MFAKTAFIVGLTLTAGAAAALDSSASWSCERGVGNPTGPLTGEQCPSPLQKRAGALPDETLHPLPDPIGDITNARGPNSRQRLLWQYAVYVSIGNRDGMQIISDQLHKLGVKREELQAFVDRATVHTGSSRQPKRAVSQVEDAWKLSQ